MTLRRGVHAEREGEAPRSSRKPDNGANLGFEAKLWLAADELRNNMDAAEYKHVVLGLIFLKYISDAFEEKHAELDAERAKGADPEDPDEYRADNIFWVPKEARWSHLQANAKQPTIGKIVDDAMVAIERDNPSLKGVLPKDYARPGARQAAPRRAHRPDRQHRPRRARTSRAKDILGRVYEYFLAQFASAEGKKGGQFYTPRCVVRVLVEMLAPYKGRVYDPCCGSGGMFVQSARSSSKPTAARIGDITHLRPGVQPHHLAAGQDEPRHPRHRGQPRRRTADSFHRDLHPDLQGRLRPGQSALQRSATGAASA